MRIKFSTTKRFKGGDKQNTPDEANQSISIQEGALLLTSVKMNLALLSVRICIGINVCKAVPAPLFWRFFHLTVTSFLTTNTAPPGPPSP